MGYNCLSSTPLSDITNNTINTDHQADTENASNIASEVVRGVIVIIETIETDQLAAAAD